MAHNGPMVHNGPPGMNETLYTGGKGDYAEGGVRVPAIAWWPGVIEPGQVVGGIIHETDLFTTFARLGGAENSIPRDRIIDGVDQTALLLNGDTHSHRDIRRARSSEPGALLHGARRIKAYSLAGPSQTKEASQWRMTPGIETTRRVATG